MAINKDNFSCAESSHDSEKLAEYIKSETTTFQFLLLLINNLS